ncbi:ATP-binding protein [Streptomyces sp. DSM 44917]|uniref:ATP-binding protein n=1 Tax=Streptomyces boetiae TaxID=3075541 RepID=A0ABU2L985_9ACTN|nr:ATP-binding protein [Streptomyces sp. DSM 44917]MDT0308134.1 ATP-binding protein [Streptomyces sp. DSM 44917]
MKQATLKTLGTAALGAALTAAAAGTASASAASMVDGVGTTAGEVVRSLPVEETAGKLPGDSGQVVQTGADLVTGETQALPLANEALSHTGGGLTEPAGQLLGGLPVTEGLGLPADQLLNGVSLN